MEPLDELADEPKGDRPLRSLDGFSRALGENTGTGVFAAVVNGLRGFAWLLVEGGGRQRMPEKKGSECSPGMTLFDS